MLSEPIFASPTEDPDRKPPLTTPEIILLKGFITRINSSGDR